MKVFISHSAQDLALIRTIAENIAPFTEVMWWEKSIHLGENNWDQIYQWIDQADLVLAIITDNTVSRGMAVGNEIGRAVAKGKKVIPLIGPEVNEKELGCLQGLVYKRINMNNPYPAIEAITREIKRAIKRPPTKYKTEKEDSGLGSFLVVAGLVGLIIWAAND